MEGLVGTWSMVLIKIYLGTYELYEGIIEHLVKKQTRALLFVYNRPFKENAGAPKWAVMVLDCRLHKMVSMLQKWTCVLFLLFFFFYLTYLTVRHILRFVSWVWEHYNIWFKLQLVRSVHIFKPVQSVCFSELFSNLWELFCQKCSLDFLCEICYVFIKLYVNKNSCL